LVVRFQNQTLVELDELVLAGRAAGGGGTDGILELVAIHGVHRNVKVVQGLGEERERGRGSSVANGTSSAARGRSKRFGALETGLGASVVEGAKAGQREKRVDAGGWEFGLEDGGGACRSRRRKKKKEQGRRGQHGATNGCV